MLSTDCSYFLVYNFHRESGTVYPFLYTHLSSGFWAFFLPTTVTPLLPSSSIQKHIDRLLQREKRLLTKPPRHAYTPTNSCILKGKILSGFLFMETNRHSSKFFSKNDLNIHEYMYVCLRKKRRIIIILFSLSFV